MTRVAPLVRPWPRPRRAVVAAVIAVCLVEVLALAVYVRLSPGQVTEWRYLLYPFVWLNVAGMAVVWTDVGRAPSRRRAVAALAALGYLLALGVIDGTIALSPGTGIDVHWALPPGWGPLVVADVGPLQVTPIPYRTVGYAAIAYLLYAALVEVSSRALGGLVGLFSCVSCTVPLLAAALSGVVGGSAAAVAAWSYDLSTAVFLLTVTLLAWQTGRDATR